MTPFRVLAGLLGAALAALLTVVATASASRPAVVDVTVHAGTRLGVVAPGAIGADAPFWNPHLTDPDTVARMRQAGIRTLDFDAGAPIDLYDWQTNSLLPDPDAARDAKAGEHWESLKPTWSFTQFAQVARAAGARMAVHVNYGTGTPQLAAAWVRQANLVDHDHIRDWMIGEEVWLDQFVEPNSRVPATLRSPQADARDYGRNVILFAQAMKAVDPSIRIGVEGFAAAPQIARHNKELRYFQEWTRALLTTPGLTHAANFVDIHYLGNFAPTFAEAYRANALLPEEIGDLRRTLDAQPGGRHVQIVAGEVNSAAAGHSWLETQGNADYLADTELSLLEHGVTETDWYSLYNGPDGPAADDFGLLSSGTCVRRPVKGCEPPAGRPFAPFWAQRLVSEATPTGAALLGASTTSPAISAYATRRHGRLRVLLVNRSARPATVRIDGLHGRLVVRIAATGHGISVRHATGSVTLPAQAVALAATVG